MLLNRLSNINNRLAKKISPAIILSWIFGISLALTGLISIFTEPVPGIFLILMSILLIPPFSNYIEKRAVGKLNKKTKILLVAFFFVAFGITIEPEDKPTEAIINITSSDVQEQSTIASIIQQSIESSIQEQINSKTENLKQNTTSTIIQDIAVNFNQKNPNPETVKPELNGTSVEYQETLLKTQTEEREPNTYYTVTKVIDGDTIDVDIDGATERLRLIGIDTPEVVDPRKPVECFGQEASKKALELLLNKKVRLEPDITQENRDKYGRLLRYIYREDGLFYNKWIIENGYAHEYTYVIPYKFQAEFQKAENFARENLLGLWHPEACISNKETTLKTTTNSIDLVAKPLDIGDGSTPPIKEEINIRSFYTSGHYSSKFYYCDSDLAWEGLSKKYLELYESESSLLKVYPTKTLHEPCK
jgi:micrococcal nuclease